MTRIAFAPALAALALFVPVLPAQDVTTDRVRALSEAARAQALTPQAQRDDGWRETHARTLYHLGRALLEIEAGNSDRAYFQDRALAAFEELVFFAGDGSPMAMHAFVGIADVHAERGEWEDAAHFYRAVAVGLLGEEGTEPRRLAPVPEPELDETRVPDGFQNEVIGLGRGFGGRSDAAGPEPKNAPPALRARLQAGDLRAREEDWEAAAREYAEIVRQLAD